MFYDQGIILPVNIDFDNMAIIKKKYFQVDFNPFQPSVAFCSAKQMTGFYIERKTGMKWIKWVYVFKIQLFQNIMVNSYAQNVLQLFN